MRPPAAIVRSVRIAGAIGELVVNTMRRHPGDGSAFKRKGATQGKKIFQPLRRPISSMGQQTVIAHADANIDRKEPKHREGDEPFPSEHKERDDGEQMKDDHHRGGLPVPLGRGCAAEDRSRSLWRKRGPLCRRVRVDRG